MNFKKLFIKLPFLAFVLFNTPIHYFAQTTVVTGTVTDASTKELLPFVTVSFPGSSVGMPTNINGKFSISSDKPYSTLKASFTGYKDVLLKIVPNKAQVVNISLTPSNQELNEVDIKAGKKPRYRNKDNPAVELIRQVIAHREQNRPTSYPYVEYREYDKMQFSISNLSKTISDKKFFRKYKFVLDNRDSTTVPGKSLLPIFLDEKLVAILLSQKSRKRKNNSVRSKNGETFADQ